MSDHKLEKFAPVVLDEIQKDGDWYWIIKTPMSNGGEFVLKIKQTRTERYIDRSPYTQSLNMRLWEVLTIIEKILADGPDFGT